MKNENRKNWNGFRCTASYKRGLCNVGIGFLISVIMLAPFFIKGQGVSALTVPEMIGATIFLVVGLFEVWLARSRDIRLEKERYLEQNHFDRFYDIREDSCDPDIM